MKKMAQSRILLSTAKPNNFAAQIMAKHLECSREVMACLPFQKNDKAKCLDRGKTQLTFQKIIYKVTHKNGSTE